MSVAEAADVAAADPSPVPGASPMNVITAAVFGLAATAFVLFYCIRYTVWWNGHLNHVLFGLWGLYWGAALAWGTLRIRPRERRRALYHVLQLMLFAQSFFLVLFWGALFIEEPSAAIGWSGLVAALAGPLVGLGFVFASRRFTILLLAEVLGPACFWALNRFGG